MNNIRPSVLFMELPPFAAAAISFVSPNGCLVVDFTVNTEGAPSPATGRDLTFRPYGGFVLPVR